MASGDDEYYYNTETGEVEQGRCSLWSKVMGPYPTAEEAARALEIARQRNAEAEAQEAEWNKDWDDDGWDDED
ncbi:MAG: SPOR domain-containing protein [Flaviflexus sp.]|nr:SPOR domain-containing protein [Flaviflexus sp.]